MNVIVELIAEVFRNAGSNTRIPFAVSSVSTPSGFFAGVVLSALNAVAGMELWVMGIVMVLPVRLSVTVKEFWSTFGGGGGAIVAGWGLVVVVLGRKDSTNLVLKYRMQMQACDNGGCNRGATTEVKVPQKAKSSIRPCVTRVQAARTGNKTCCDMKPVLSQPDADRLILYNAESWPHDTPLLVINSRPAIYLGGLE